MQAGVRRYNESVPSSIFHSGYSKWSGSASPDAILPIVFEPDSDFEGLVLCSALPDYNQPLRDDRGRLNPLFRYLSCVEVGSVYPSNASARETSKANTIFSLSPSTSRHFRAHSLDVVCAKVTCRTDNMIVGFAGPYSAGYAVAYRFGHSRMRVLDFVEVQNAPVPV